MDQQGNQQQNQQNKPDQQNRPRSGRGSNLTNEHRRRGGESSAQSQGRDERGQFAGKDKDRQSGRRAQGGQMDQGGPPMDQSDGQGDEGRQGEGNNRS